MSCLHTKELREFLSNFPSGEMFFLGCHLIDLIVQIMGVPDEVLPLSLSSGKDGVCTDDIGMAVFKYKNGIATAKVNGTEVGGFSRRQLVIAGEKGAYLIDWEYGGILPYPTAIARFLAHSYEDENAFFYMKDEDRRFAVDYYYDSFIKHKGISRSEYDRTIDLFMIYEYCEWIMIGNKYPNGDMIRYKAYLEKIRKYIKNM